MIKNSDIATLELNKLFTGLSSLAENNRKSAAGRKPGKKVKAPPQDKRPLVYRTPWTDEAVILIITHTSCQCCNSEWVEPNSHLLLRRTHRQVGTHLKPMQPGEQYPHLPHRREHLTRTVEACHICFPISEAIVNLQATNCRQRKLDLELTEPDLYLNPPLPPEGSPKFGTFHPEPFKEFTPSPEPPRRECAITPTYINAPKED